MKRLGRQHAEGFTLLEALLAAVVLAFAAVAITVPFASAARNEQTDARRTLAVSLAQELMEEILSRPFMDGDPSYARNAGPDPGESTRSLFDNVDDYDGHTEPPGAITDMAGNVVDCSVSEGLSRRATVSYVHVSGQEMSEPPTFVCVVVEVRYAQRPVVTLTRLVYAVPQEGGE